MPKPSVYTPARRYTMQAIMWVVLGINVGLAGWVTHVRRQANRVDLSAQPVTAGDVSVRLPAKWRARQGGAVADVRLIAQATENESGDRRGRTIQILRDRLDQPMSPLQYLSQNF